MSLGILVLSLSFVLVSCATSCDDGNKANGDGCSSSLVVEYGYSCSGSVPQACGVNITYGENMAANVGGSIVCGMAALLALISFVFKGKVCSAFYNCVFSVQIA